MATLRSLFLLGGLTALAQAFTQPTSQTWGPLLTPNLSNSVAQGRTATITWDPENHPTNGVTVSLVLCRGPGSNCVLASSAIAEGIPAAQRSYSWQVPCSLPAGTQQTSTGYGMLIIVDGTGEFQYSTQFSVLENPSCASGSPTGSGSGSASNTTTAVTVTSTGSGTSGNSGSTSATRTITYTDSSGRPDSTSIVTPSTITDFPTPSTTLISTSIGTDQTYSSDGSAETGVGTTIHGTAYPSGAAATSAYTDAAPRATGGVMGVLAVGAVALFAL